MQSSSYLHQDYDTEHPHHADDKEEAVQMMAVIIMTIINDCRDNKSQNILNIMAIMTMSSARQ